MSVEVAREHLKKFGKDGDILEFEESSATVELAAKAVGTEPARIAKSLTYEWGEDGLMIVTAGDMRVQNKKFKEEFGAKARMLKPDDVLRLTNHEIGGVCPFGVPKELPVYLDVSLRRFDVVYPAAGTARNAVPMTIDELYEASGARGWVDVCDA